ncbi:MAG: hypothetical protein ACOC4M_11030 [Promethearchaeia archaeon]
MTDQPETFAGLTNLRRLDLSANRLTELPDIFYGFSKLIFNKLTNLPDSVSRLSRSRNFYIDENPLEIRLSSS